MDDNQEFWNHLKKYETMAAQEKWPDALAHLDEAILSCPSSSLLSNYLAPLRKVIKTRAKPLSWIGKLIKAS